MKTILFLVLSLSSFNAMADYFYCTLEYGPFLSTTVEAEYRVREASVSARTFECEGKITGRQTTVTITSTETGETATSTENHSTATVEMWSLNQWGDGQDHGTCTCGMQ